MHPTAGDRIENVCRSLDNTFSDVRLPKRVRAELDRAIRDLRQIEVHRRKDLTFLKMDNATTAKFLLKCGAVLPDELMASACNEPDDMQRDEAELVCLVNDRLRASLTQLINSLPKTEDERSIRDQVTAFLLDRTLQDPR